MTGSRSHGGLASSGLHFVEGLGLMEASIIRSRSHGLGIIKSRFHEGWASTVIGAMEVRFMNTCPSQASSLGSCIHGGWTS